MLLDKLQLNGQVLTYLDDILIHRRTESEHLHALDKVLEAHTDAGIKLKAKKMFLFKKTVDFLGHRVSADRISLSMCHIETIKALTSRKKVQQLVCFLQYFLSFELGFIQLTGPMNALQNKRHLGHKDWTEECKENLEKLKDMFAEPGLMQHYPLPVDDPDAGKFEVHMDSSAQALAACLY